MWPSPAPSTTRKNPGAENGVPLGPAGTLMLVGDMKRMDPRYLVGVSFLGYGCSLAVGVGIPIPLLNEEMAHFCGVSDADLMAPIVDYGGDYPAGTSQILGQVSYAQLKSGTPLPGGQRGAHGAPVQHGAGPGDRPAPEAVDRIRPVPPGGTGGAAAPE